jgi:hypothetical protein
LPLSANSSCAGWFRECIEQHIPPGYMNSLEIAEKSEREILMKIHTPNHSDQR